jgi:hypothetical protein
MAAEVILRQEVCRCGRIFYICRSCDRGQRYCSEHCRQKARRQQRREANRRHQQSPEGRLDHRDRQRLYRERLALRQERVTDQGSPASNSSGTMRPDRAEPDQIQQPSEPALDSGLMFCVRCGKAGYPIASRLEMYMGERTEAPARQSEQEYVRRLLDVYVSLPETPARWHSTDRRMAQELFGRQIPLDVVEVAFVLGSARRLARDPNRIVPPIRCLAYFLPVIEEVLAEPPPPRYIQYLRLFHLQPVQKHR